MKKILLALLPFLFIVNANAVTIDYYKQFNGTTNAHFGICNGINNCPSYSPLQDASINDSDKVLTQFVTNNMSFNLNKIYTLQFYSSEGFVKDNYYTVNILTSTYFTNSTLPSNHTQVSGTGLSVGAYHYSSDVILSEQINVSVYLSHYNQTLNGFGNVLTYTFKAPLSGNWIILDFKSRGSGNNQFDFYGYNLINHGSKAPSTEDITNALNSQFNSINENITNVEQNIQASVNESTNMITGSVDAMKDSINDSINSEDSDVNSSKCGLVCKLKGIFTGIINLPQNIWNFLKVGFDAITGSISDLFNGILNIFTPDGGEGECKTPNNVIDLYNKSSYLLYYSNMGRLNANNEFETGGSVDLHIPDINKYADKTYTLIFDYDYRFNYGTSTVNHFDKKAEVCYFSSKSFASRKCFNYTSKEDKGHGYLTFTIESNVINSYLDIDKLKISFYGDMYTNGIYTNVMLVEGSEDMEYTPFGEEVCTETEKKSFLVWLGDFFSNIIGGILELPGKLVSLLLEGLKSLFVPTSDQLYDIVNKSKDLTEDFGFVGQSVNFFLEIFTSLLGLVNQDGCIELPAFKLGKTSLFDAHTFWEEQNVCLSDNVLLSKNITLIRSFTSIVLVCMFLNFAASKFFGILSKNDSGTVVDSGSGSGYDYYVENGTRVISRWGGDN